MLKICTILFFVLKASYSLDTLPMFLIDNGLLDGVIKPLANPLIQIDNDKLASIMDSVQDKCECIIFFIEEKFCMEDVSKKDKMGTPFVNLNNAFKNGEVKQFLRVVHPYTYFKTRFPPYDFNTFHIRSTSTKLRLEENYKFMYVFFEDGVHETRTQQLRRHDAIIKEVLFVVKQLAKGPVTAIYTGKINPVNLTSTGSNDFAPRQVKPLQVARTNDKWERVTCNGNVVFQFYGAKIRHDGKYLNMIPTGCTMVIYEKSGDYENQYYNVHFNADAEHSAYIRFTVTKYNNGACKIMSISYSGNVKQMDIDSKWHTTYESITPIEVGYLKLPQFVISFDAKDGSDKKRKEPPITRSGSDDKDSGDKSSDDKSSGDKGSGDKGSGDKGSGDKGSGDKGSGDKGSGDKSSGDKSSGDKGSDDKGSSKEDENFISVGILSGLLVMFIFVSVLSWGIMNLMSIQTNTRYDNPDAKPLFNPDTVGE